MENQEMGIEYQQVWWVSRGLGSETRVYRSSLLERKWHLFGGVEARIWNTTFLVLPLRRNSSWRSFFNHSLRDVSAGIMHGWFPLPGTTVSGARCHSPSKMKFIKQAQNNRKELTCSTVHYNVCEKPKAFAYPVGYVLHWEARILKSRPLTNHITPDKEHFPSLLTLWA